MTIGMVLVLGFTRRVKLAGRKARKPTDTSGMNAGTAALVATAAKAALEYIRADQKRQYALLSRSVVYIDGPGVGKYRYQDEVLGIVSPNENSCILTAEPFAASSDNWNGPDLLPDSLSDGSFEMSLWHDLVVKRAGKIAASNPRATKQQVMAWANALVPALMTLYAKKKPKRWWKRAIYGVLELGRPIYHPLKRLLRPVLGCLLLSACGCDAPPDWRARGGDDAAIVWELDGKVHTNAPVGWYGENAPDWFVQGGIAAPGLATRAPVDFVTNADQRGLW